MSRMLLSVCALLALLAGPTFAARNSFNQDSKVVTQHRGRIEVLDPDARIYLYRNFLSDEECDHLRETAIKRLERSGVVDTPSGGTAINDIRTSDGMFFARAEDEVIEAVERRLAEWTLLPVHFGESLQVLRYRKEQKYDSHWDYFFHKGGDANGGNRYATVLMYLQDVEEGGETKFPKIPAPHGVNMGMSECAKYNLAYKPRKGDALLFHSMTPDGKLEERSMHGACPVVRGEKWSMTKWYHAKHYRMGDKYDEEVDAALQRQRAFMDEHGTKMGPDAGYHAQPLESTPDPVPNPLPNPIPRRSVQESGARQPRASRPRALIENLQRERQQQGSGGHHYAEEVHGGDGVDSDNAQYGAAHHYYSDENHGSGDEPLLESGRASAHRYAEENHDDAEPVDAGSTHHYYSEEQHGGDDDDLPQQPKHSQGLQQGQGRGQQRHRETRAEYRERVAREARAQQHSGNF